MDKITKKEALERGMAPSPMDEMAVEGLFDLLSVSLEMAKKYSEMPKEELTELELKFIATVAKTGMAIAFSQMEEIK